MRRSIPSKTLDSSIEFKKKLNDSILFARQRALEVRKKASFGNSSSGYEFGGWKSLFEDQVESPKLSPTNSPTDSTKPNLNKITRTAQKTFETTLCPSSRPNTDNALVFGVVKGTVESPRVDYLERSQPIEKVIKQLSDPIKPTEMLRIASSCQEKGCLHFDGINCRLAIRVVEQLPSVTEVLPPCQIRSSCRWWQQEGKSACLRCPQVVTENYYSSPLIERVAEPNPKKN